MKAAYIFSIFFSMLFSSSLFAQIKPVVKPAVVDTATPVITMKFGAYADSAKLLSSSVKQIIKNELKATDAKGVVYTIIGFSFSWKRKDTTDDLQTGKPKTIFLYNSVDVRAETHIPLSWQQEISGYVQPKEEFRFDAILVQNPKTKKIYKPGTVTLFVL